MNESIEHSNLDQVVVLLKFDVFCSVSHSIVIILGIPLNLTIIIVMFSSQRLRKKPRNILFLGVILSSLFTLLTVMLELIANHHQNPEIFCMVSGLGSGVAYTCFLKNLLLALLDRYLAITRPLLHRKIVTVKNVRIIQIIGGIVIFLLIKWPFIFGVVPFQCGFLLVEIQTIALHQAILILLCVVLYILVYFKTKQYARPNRVISVSYVSNQQQSVSNTLRKSGISHQSEAPSSRSASINQNTSTELQVHGGSPRMEIEATFTVLSGVSSLLIFSAPTLIVGFVDLGCRFIVGELEYQEQCTAIVVYMPYLRELLLYHLVYHPMSYMIRSREFSSTLNEKWTKITHHHHRQQHRPVPAANQV